MSETHHPRVHAIIARKSNNAIVIRRGPSGMVASLGWNLSNDKITLGQWLTGRIYERRSDISPDGKFFIYFARKNNMSSSSPSSWTSVSKTPYLKALDFFPKGNCWEGGGMFLGQRKYFLNDRYYRQKEQERRESGLECQTGVRAKHALGAECLSIYFPRLIRDGWKLNREEVRQDKKTAVLEKQAHRDWVLRKLAHSGGNTKPGQSIYWDEHELVSPKGKITKFPDWEWADVHDKTIVFAENGMLFRAKLTQTELLRPRLIQDFSEYVFKNIRAPY